MIIYELGGALKGSYIILICILVVLFLHSINVYSALASSIVVNIDEDGIVDVTILMEVDEGVHSIPAPVDPIYLTITATANNIPLPIIYSNGYLYFVLDSKADVIINYIANVSMDNGIFNLGIRADEVVEVRIPSNIVLLSWPGDNLVDAKVNQSMLILFLKGPLTLKYVIKPSTKSPPPTLTNWTSPTISPAPQPSTPSQSPTPSPIQTPTAQYPEPTTLVTVLGVIVIAVILTAYLIRRRGASASNGVLDDVDKNIIKALEARGGTALQSELQSDVKVPKTTLWRHVRKLEKLGIVKVEKVGLQNKIVLMKKVKI